MEPLCSRREHFCVFNYVNKLILRAGHNNFINTFPRISFVDAKPMDKSTAAEFLLKLLTVLKKITVHDSKGVDNSYVEKLLSNLRFERDEILHNYFMAPELLLWLKETLHLWKTHTPNASVAAFLCEFIGILSRNEDRFKTLKDTSTLEDLCAVLLPVADDNTCIKIAFLRLMNDVVSHRTGCDWVIESKCWKTVIKWYLINTNFYVEQEGFILFRKLIKEIGDDDDDDGTVIKDIFQEILIPLEQIIKISNNGVKFNNTIRTSFKLLQGILKIFVTSSDENTCFKILKTFDIEKLVSSILENCHDENTLESVSCVHILTLALKFPSKQHVLSMDDIPEEVLQVFVLLLQQNQINCIIKLSKFCQLLWSEIRKELKCESKTAIHFLILQLIPVLCYKQAPESKIFDSLLQKLFDLTSTSTRKFGYSLRDKIRRKKELKNWALKTLHCISSQMDALTQSEAVLIFQCLANVFHFFGPEKNSDQEKNECGEGSVLCDEDLPILSVVLNSLCILIEKFRINWAESLESLCLVKMTCDLLQNTSLSCILIVQTLLLVKLAIINYMSVDLALLLNNTENSSLKCLLPLLYKHMHNRNWEIRDSSIEVLTTITDLAESKYPAFQGLLLERNFCHLIFGIMQGDSESYVRASAIRCLSAMTKIERLRTSLHDLDMTYKIVDLLKEESEGIVRREAVLLLKEIYLHSDVNPELNDLFYEVMGFTSICDLHWEVKVNSLLFWEAVIQKIFADQGMIDGSFPKVTFSKEHKKIVTLTPDEIKLRLTKALAELSRIGCLHVILSGLNDECDFQVVEKLVEILRDFLNILKRYEVLPSSESQPSNRVPLKRKHRDFQSSEVRKSLCKTTMTDDGSKEGVENPADSEGTDWTNDPDSVIEEIVNEMDINLLVSVHRTQEKGTQPGKKMILQAVNPDMFLLQMQEFECEQFLENKKKWLTNSNNDLKSLINDIIMVNSVCETNAMDCY